MKSPGLDRVRDRLEDIGFKKPGAVYTMSVSDEELGWLGLNQTLQHYSAGEVARDAFKFTTTNGGTSTQLRLFSPFRYS